MYDNIEKLVSAGACVMNNEQPTRTKLLSNSLYLYLWQQIVWHLEPVIHTSAGTVRYIALINASKS